MKASVLRRERMLAVIEAIARHRATHGYAPSARELREEAGLSSISVVWYWLNACEHAGLIARAPGLARAITLTEKGDAFARSRQEESPSAADRRVA